MHVTKFEFKNGAKLCTDNNLKILIVVGCIGFANFQLSFYLLATAFLQNSTGFSYLSKVHELGLEGVHELGLEVDLLGF